MAMTIVESAAVTGGVNTHGRRQVAAGIDDTDTVVGVAEFPGSAAGCQALLDWLAGFGPVRRVGIDTTEDRGGSLARHLQHAGVAVVVVDPGEEAGPLDAVEMARAARSGGGEALPGWADTLVEAIGVLLVARRSAEVCRAAAVEGIRALVAAAPADVGLGLFWRTERSLIAETAALQVCPGHPVGYAARVALAELGGRAVWLGEQIARLDELLVPLMAARAAGLLATFATGSDGTPTLLAATDNKVGA